MRIQIYVRPLRGEPFEDTVEHGIERRRLALSEQLLDMLLGACPPRFCSFEDFAPMRRKLKAAGPPVAAIRFHSQQSLTLQRTQIARERSGIHDQLLGQFTDADAVESHKVAQHAILGHGQAKWLKVLIVDL